MMENITFEKKVKWTIRASIAIALLGVLTVVLWTVFSTQEADLGFSEGFYVGLGGGLIGAGTVTLIKNLCLLRNKERFHKAEIEFLDERNRFISRRVWSTGGFSFGVLLYLAVIVAGLCDLTVFATLLCTLGVLMLTLLITKIVLSKLY